MEQQKTEELFSFSWDGKQPLQTKQTEQTEFIEQTNVDRERRFSVSSEPYKPSDCSSPRTVIAKPEAARALIASAFARDPIFQHLDEQQVSQVTDAMFLKTFPAANIDIIREGDDGDLFYVVQAGQLVVLKKSKQEEQDQVAELAEGQCFGEIALLHNCKRTATVRTKGPVELWAIDGKTFRTLVLDRVYQKRKAYCDFLRSVPLLKDMSDADIVRMSELLTPRSFLSGEAIVKQGDVGHDFYIIEKGIAVVSIQKGEEQEATVKKLSEGDYFGELALMNDTTRAATVRAEGNVSCLTLNCIDFNRLLGPLKPTLERQQEQYRTYQQIIKQSAEI